VPSDVSVQFLVDGKNRFHLAYTVRSLTYGVYSALGYMRSVDAGAHWDFPLTFPSSVTSPGVAQIAVFSFGEDEIHLTYDLPERMHQWSYDGGENWSRPITIINGVNLGAAFGGPNELVKDSSGSLHVVSAWGGGVYHATWERNSWGLAEPIDLRGFDPHGQTMTLCQGNRLSVLYYDRTAENEIWYSELMLNLLHIPQSLIPNPISTPANFVTPTFLVGTNENKVSTPTLPASFSISESLVQQSSSGFLSITLAIVLVMLLVLVVLIYTVKQR
jgi:hypothetical protein